MTIAIITIYRCDNPRNGDLVYWYVSWLSQTTDASRSLGWSQMDENSEWFHQLRVFLIQTKWQDVLINQYRNWIFPHHLWCLIPAGCLWMSPTYPTPNHPRPGGRRGAEGLWHVVGDLRQFVQPLGGSWRRCCGCWVFPKMEDMVPIFFEKFTLW